MKKFIAPLLIIILLASGLFIFKEFNSNNTIVIPENQPTGYESKVIVSIDFGNKDIKVLEITAGTEDTAFSVLKKISETNNIELVTKQYDFGVFVEKVGDFESTAKRSWIYYVNGESGQIAADQMKLKNGDKVDWKYEVPKF